MCGRTNGKGEAAPGCWCELGAPTGSRWSGEQPVCTRSFPAWRRARPGNDEMRERSTLHKTINQPTAGPGGQGTASGADAAILRNRVSKGHIEKVKICQVIGRDEEVSYAIYIRKVSPAEGTPRHHRNRGREEHETGERFHSIINFADTCRGHHVEAALQRTRC